MVQDALRMLAPEDEAPSARLDVARRVMRHLPPSNWLHANRNFADHISGGDAGLYDLLLNPRDRAYTVTELHALLAGAGVQVTCWMEPARYDPALYLPDAKLKARIAAMDPLARSLAPVMLTPVLRDFQNAPVFDLRCHSERRSVLDQLARAGMSRGTLPRS